MSKPTPSDMSRKMVQAAQAAESIEDMPFPGHFAREYGEAIKDDLDADNVEAFVHGTAVLNVLIQEAVLRVTTVAQNTETSDGYEETYAEGVKDGAMLIAQIMATTADAVIQSMIEEPAIQRAFNNIVANF